ncbi:hypothetical protein SEA_JDAWG_49 [Microbacterium phage JDawG]|nr:hypothetical protein SEA_JDAWG_49 [Microbacterium phage JDawG]
MNTQKIENLDAEIVEYNSEIAALEAKIEEYKSEIRDRRQLILALRQEDANAERGKAVAAAKLVRVDDYFGEPMAEVKLVQTHAGREVEYSGRRSYDKKMITVGKAWDVLLGDEVIGTIEYRMFTREDRTPGRMYVNSRWESPGWGYTEGARHTGRQWEARSKKDALERIVRAHTRKP